MKLDNCSRILKIYKKLLIASNFIKIIAIEVDALSKNNFLKHKFSNSVFFGVRASLGS